jgi:hypothetical protein
LNAPKTNAKCIAPSLDGARRFHSQLHFHSHSRLAVAGALVEDEPPKALGFRAVAALFGEAGESEQGQMAEDALVDTAKLVGTPERLDSPPAGCGLGGLTCFTLKNGLEKIKLRDIEIEQ